MEHRGFARLSTAAGLVFSMIAPVVRILAIPASIFLFLAFYEYTKAGLKWRSAALRFGTYGTCGLGLFVWALSFWEVCPWPMMAEILIGLGTILAMLLILRTPEEALTMPPTELMREYWGAAGADDKVSRDKYFREHYGGRFYRVVGTVAWTQPDDDKAVVQIKWQPNRQTHPVFFDLYCDGRHYRPVTDGTPVTGEGRIRSADGSIILDGAKLFT